MDFNRDIDWLRRRAELEDNCFVSVGGLVLAVEEMEQQSAPTVLTRPAFVRLLELTRREHKLTWDTFAKKLDVDLVELIGIATEEHYKPLPRTVTRIAQFINVPAQKLFVLSGLARAKDSHFQEAALKFAARSQPVEELTREEHVALEEYVKFLCEK